MEAPGEPSGSQINMFSGGTVTGILVETWRARNCGDTEGDLAF